jgi:protease I
LPAESEARQHLEPEQRRRSLPRQRHEPAGFFLRFFLRSAIEERTMPKIADSHILIMATHGFEERELLKPLEQLKAKGAKVEIAAPERGQIKAWRHKDWGSSVPVDLTLEEVKVGDYDALILPGGQMNPDTLRINDEAIAIIKAFLEGGKVVAAICHGPQLLIEAGALKGREVTSYISIRTDVINAGARWVDQQVAVDNGIITSRHPGDLDAFIAKIVEKVEAGPHLPPA